MTKRNVAYDCRYFLGDRPCVWHKLEGAVCACDHNEPVGRRVLIIKLDAMGDVLRTTCILPGIKSRWPQSAVTWITSLPSVPLLQNNSCVREIFAYGPDALLQLSVRKFDTVISLDAGQTSAALAAMAQADEKIGFVLHEKGFVTATNAAAEKWLELGVFDDLKRTNVRTHQEIMCSILGLPSDETMYVFDLTEGEIAGARSHLESIGVDFSRPLIGINTGGGGRWRYKQWNEQSFPSLIRELLKDRADDIQIVLFGGPLERELNRRIIEGTGAARHAGHDPRLGNGVFDGGYDNDVRHFAALVKHCSVVLSADSLAMHIALAVGTRVVVLFGPTSHAEIELFGQGEKVVPDLDCLVCYKQDCDIKPNCMDSISVETVKQAILRQLVLVNNSQCSNREPGGQPRKSRER